MTTPQKAIFFIVLCTASSYAFGQITPPGMGVANTASWLAFGLRQDLDTLKAWQSMSYMGMGRKSDPDNYSPFHKSSILVLNQEFYHQFHHHGQYSFAVSYRRQNEYNSSFPYELDTPAFRQELRLYGRLSYVVNTPRIKWVSTYRQDIRSFYTPQFSPLNESFQLRSRLRMQITINLTHQKTHRMIAGAESLFSVSRGEGPKHWKAFRYQESRLSAFYSFSPQTSPFIFNIGYMCNVVGSQSVFLAHYLAVDVVIENPFKLRKRSKANINENLE